MYDTARDKTTGAVGTIRKVKGDKVDIQFPGKKPKTVDHNTLIKLNR